MFQALHVLQAPYPSLWPVTSLLAPLEVAELWLDQGEIALHQQGPLVSLDNKISQHVIFLWNVVHIQKHAGQNKVYIAVQA